jgi:glycosyltransferase involved in cell wall biosynthesis
MNRATSSRSRIVHILPVIGHAGAEQMAANLLVGLSQSYDVAAVGLYDSVASATETTLKRAGIPIWFLGKHPGFDARMFRRLDRALREIQPDLVHTHLSVLRYLLPSLIRRPSVICVHTVHSLAEHETDLLGRFVRRLAFDRFVRPVAVSQAVARSVSRLYKLAEPAMIPNGIPVSAFHFNPVAREQWRKAHGFDPDVFLFIATGRLEAPKNPVLILRAFAELADSRCQLLFVGDGPLHKQVEEQISLLGLERRAHILGRRTDIPDCLAASDAFVLCSDWEGNPLGLMEAMACGLPAVATSVGGVPELMNDRHNGLLIPPGDCDALRLAMRSLLESPQLRHSLRCAAFRRAEAEFGLERMIESYDRLYQSLLGQSTAKSIPLAFAG